MATTYSADEPDRLRGPQHSRGWCDEIAAWNYAQEAWDMFMFGLRLGSDPRAMVTTTPRPIPLLRQIVASSTTVVTRGSTYSNRANLAASFLDKIVTRFEGTRLGRQELNGEMLDDVPGALWTRAMIDIAKAEHRIPDMQRVVVAIDPSGTAGEDDEGDSIGIVVAGKGVDGIAYVLADRTCKLSPAAWAKRAVNAVEEFKADRIIAERNFGGAMVEAVIRAAGASVPYKEVTASRGKVVRAEPIAALYEQGRVRHVGGMEALEDQMCAMTSDGYLGEGSPDRADALVWALTELMLGGSNYSLANV
jgi:phage terminase large subunit-like protein